MMKKFTLLFLFILTLGIFNQAYSQTYCTPTWINYGGWNMGFVLVQVGTINNPSGTPTGAGASYWDYTSQSTTALMGATVNYTLQIGPTYGQWVCIWIDYNNNGVFTDPGELVAQMQTTTGGYTFTGSFTVPTGISPGPKRMRLMTEYYGSNVYPTSCGPVNYAGECEDYTLNIQSPNPWDLDISSLLPVVAKIGSNNVTATLKNNGINTLTAGTTINLQYNVNGGGWVTTSFNLASNLTAGSTLNYTFATPWIISVTQAYTLCAQIYPQIPNDPDATDLLCKSVPIGMAGIYTIDPAGSGARNYVSFTAAVNDLQSRGVADAVTFNVAKGTYTEAVNFTQTIIGVSATYPIIFDGGNRADVILTYGNTVAASNWPTIRLLNASYVTFQNMTIKNTGTTYFIGVAFMGNAKYNNFINCLIDIPSVANSSYIPVMFANSTTSYSTPSSGCDYNTIRNCTINGGYFGVTMYGSGTSSNVNNYNQFIGNVFSNQNYYSFYRFYASTGLLFKNNKFMPPTTNGGYSIYSYYANNTTLDGNIFQPNCYAVAMYYENYTMTGTDYIINNMIGNFTYTGSQYGLYLYYSNNFIIQHNTLAVNPASASTSYTGLILQYINVYTSGSTLIQSRIENNTFINYGTGGNGSCIYSYSGTYASMDYNDYYYPNGASYICYWEGNQFSNLAQWKASYSSFNMNSTDQVNPQVRSYADLHLNAGSKGFLGTKTNIPTDADNDPRCSIVSYLGADEPFHAIPTIGFISTDTVCLKTAVTFYNQGVKGDPNIMAWKVDNVQKATTFDFVYTFQTQKWDTIQMIYQSCLRKDTITKVLYVAPGTKAPKTEFMISKNIAETNEPLQLSDLSQYCPTKWLWDIYPDSVIDPVDGLKKLAYAWINSTNDTFQTPMIKFFFPGIFGVCLSNQNNIGKGVKVCKNNYINIKLAQNMCGTSTESTQQYGSLYDDGGAGNYTANNSTCTYLIKSCGAEVDATFSQLALASGTYLRIYDGINNKGIKLWDAGYGANGISGDITNSLFKTVYKATQSGMLYIEFQKGPNSAAGFKLDWITLGTKSYIKPHASFTSDDTGCVVYPFYYKNTTTNADYNFTRFRWDYDGNGVIDATTVDGVFNTTFPGVSAIYISRLMADNCGGVDTFTKHIVLVNPISNPKGDFIADVTKPLVGQDVVTFSNNFEKLSCVNTWEWSITPSKWYFANGTTLNSAHPQVVFADTGCYDVTLKMGNTNSAFTKIITKHCYIKPLTYCNPVVTTKHQDIGISRVKIGAIDNKTAIGVSGYTSYTNVTSTNVVAGQKTAITIERITSFNPMSRYVWIDYNGNGSFNDPGELVLHQDSSRSLSWTDTIAIPRNVKLGSTTMRIGTNYAGYNNTPCGPNLFGEYEDYRLFIFPDNIAPVITIIGGNPTSVEVGYPYSDSGATALDNIEGIVTNRIVTTSNVDTTKVGSYSVTYNICDSLNNCSSATRTVNVTVDLTPPILILKGKSSIVVSINYPFVDPGYIAYDRASGDLTPRVIVTSNVNINKIGNFYIVYSVTDNAGFTATATRLVEVKDDAPPSISLIGPNPLYLEIGNAYTEPGVVYADNYWPNNKITYQKSGFVDTTKVGTYMVYYSVTDASGNGPNTISRKVIVWDSTAPVVTITGNDAVMLEVHTKFFDPGVTITDNSKSGFTVVKTGSFYDLYANGIPDSIGLFSIFYKVYDEAGNMSNIVARVIEVVDIRAPEITLKGDPYVSIERWSTYVDAGYTITDNYYAVKDLRIDTFNNVNIHQTGIYEVKYSAKDPSGNVSPTIVRLVRVIQTLNGISENTQPTLGVYPNPSKGKFILSLYLPKTLEARISILNQLGEEVSLVHSGNLLSAEYSVDLSQMPSGVYTVKVQTENASLLKRVIITK